MGNNSRALLSFAHDRDCPVGSGLIDKIIAVLFVTFDGDEQRFRFDRPGVVFYLSYIDIYITGRYSTFDILDELA